MSADLQQGTTNAADFSLTVLRARIALLATAIGGPDYTSQIDPPPYKLGDDCLACLKDRSNISLCRYSVTKKYRRLFCTAP